MREILDAARGLRALVVGDLMLDAYISGRVDRISPEAPVPVVHVESEGEAVGGAGNVAAGVLALGARCSVVGLVGRDAAGERLLEALSAVGADVDGVVRVEGRPTTVKTRVTARRQQVVRFDREDPSDITGSLCDRLARAVEDHAEGADVVILEDYNKGVFVPAVVQAGLEAAERLDVPSVVDPKRRRFFEYRGATVFKPNAKELEDALGEPVLADDPDWMEAVRDRLGCGTLLLTLGERGMALRTEEELVRVPALARSVYDVSGAGDTVTAVTAVALAAGASPVEAAVLANHAAAVEVGRAGVSTVSADEILAHAGVVDEAVPIEE